MSLWPHNSTEEQSLEMATLLGNSDRYSQYIAYKDSNIPTGFIEFSIRIDYVKGSSSSLVLFLEGIYLFRLGLGFVETERVLLSKATNPVIKGNP